MNINALRCCSRWLVPALSLFASALLPACSSVEEPSVDTTTRGDDLKNTDLKRVVLIYAVASNNLSTDLRYDMQEIIDAAPSLDLKKNAWLIYAVGRKRFSGDPEPEAALMRLVPASGAGGTKTFRFDTVATYSRDIYSTDPRRMRQVYDDVKNTYISDTYGLIFWSHGGGWSPYFGNPDDYYHDDDPSAGVTAIRQEQPRVPGQLVSWFGTDQINNADVRCNIDDLAAAIPSGMFDFIWFDCCMMGGIETVYQLRDKADFIVAYPTEIDGDGMPYDITAPYLLRPDADLEGAAKAVYDHYMSIPFRGQQFTPVTVAVVKTSELAALIPFCREALAAGNPLDTDELQRYSRGKSFEKAAQITPFFDFGQYIRLSAGSSWDADRVSLFNAALDRAVVYKAASPLDFNLYYGSSYKVAIAPENFSGLSTHCFRGDGSMNEEFYASLDWYKAVY